MGTACYGALTFTEAPGILLCVWSAASVPAFPVMQVTTALAHISVFRSSSTAVPAVITILLAALGMVYQFRGGRKRKRGAK